ncbi:hypothetical protein HNR02_006342 [Amycolatopsis endophytica]|uniref:Uncharacterized protein n=1 Tax=Amycolatopsis endophytica TaxID=860233 RepID=A0A853BEF2_9PSEU|nr:hypothetical protein [Amycolatopsis endophytica]NYI92967.1 hypothetical protein [Amycolatopsis endophytica]
MSEPAAKGDNRKRGNIRQRGKSLQVRVYAGIDPMIGRQSSSLRRSRAPTKPHPARRRKS